jgi:hypothetical protein
MVDDFLMAVGQYHHPRRLRPPPVDDPDRIPVLDGALLDTDSNVATSNKMAN